MFKINQYFLRNWKKRIVEKLNIFKVYVRNTCFNTEAETKFILGYTFSDKYILLNDKNENKHLVYGMRH